MTRPFFHLSASHFPLVTRDALPLATILKLGCLPLGYKTAYRLFRARRLLNVGFLEPGKIAVTEVEHAVRGTVDGIQVFRLEPAELLTVLCDVYRVEKDSLLARPETEVAPALRSLLRHSSPEIVPLAP